MLWLKEQHPYRFQELSSSEGLSLAAAFTESTEPDSLGLGLMDSSAVSHLDVEQQANLTPAANTDQSLVQIADKTHSTT